MPTKTEPFDPGDDVTVTLRFTNAADAPADPAACATKVQSPTDHKTGSITRSLVLADLTHAGTGVYTFVQRVTEAELWYVKATATFSDGTQQVRVRTIEVSQPQVP
jgi:hypothetical protein